MVRIKRVYDPPSPRDGRRVLVDRIWPRGVTKARARLDAWRKDLAPSSTLRKWFGHDPAKWTSFRARYRAELMTPARRGSVKELAREARRRTITLLYGGADNEHNQARVLKELLEHLQRGSV